MSHSNPEQSLLWFVVNHLFRVLSILMVSKPVMNRNSEKGLGKMQVNQEIFVLHRLNSYMQIRG